MALIITGKKFIKDVETAGAVGAYVPLEGGFEGRYKRRLRAAGYATQFVSAPGLGDVSAFMTDVHGVRPPHLGKQDLRRFFLPPFLTYHLENLPPRAKGLVLWLYDGKKLTQQELAYFCDLTQQEPRLKVVVELGGDRKFSWKPLRSALEAA
ncbi:NAD(P)H-quinone oxidoreductase subunit N [Lyngbya confervoides]|uniref:NAD(P)H-quinone oxidoreductase subunit N n=1 Tax=Lyngbya confervoides BDU141951 TaxID=1574623 RepID=A0ABD4T3S6_9CYAN|nr:NAD(P)H-quinone oxidoreductase subunit N [Lyngbya confervoides]MCM1982887.1 NAD(P)H-quinone oxidoreductase subunit N [Lyngbya confervoides BDU141951]